MSYTAGFAWLLGGGIATLAMMFLVYGEIDWTLKSLFKFIVIIIKGILAVLLIGLMLLLFLGRGCRMSHPPNEVRGISGYMVAISPVASSTDSFTIKESVVYSMRRLTEQSEIESEGNPVGRIRREARIDEDDPPVDVARADLEERIVSSRKVGFLTREVSFAPLSVDSSGVAELTLPDGTHWRGELCPVRCPTNEIMAINLPKDSFFEARYTWKVEKSIYADTETILWSTPLLDSGISFTYTPPPYNYLRPVLSPFIGLSTMTRWIVGMLGFIVPIIGAYMIGPVLADEAKKPFRWLYDKALAIRKRRGGKLSANKKKSRKKK